MPSKNAADGGRGYSKTELEQLALDAAFSPAWILATEAQDEIAVFIGDGGALPSRSPTECRPSSAHEFSMPAQQRCRGKEKPTGRQVASKRGQDEAVGGHKLGAVNLPAENCHLMAQAEELEIALSV